MWLVNFPKIRIEKYSKGYVVEIQKCKWYGKKYWTHIESVSGIESMPWYYDTFDRALESAVLHFKWDLKIGTIDYSINIKPDYKSSLILSSIKHTYRFI